MKIKPIHPGHVLLKEFLQPLKVSQYKLAKDILVPSIRISQIIRGRRAISADTALRFGRYFGTSAEFWLNLQAHYDLEIANDKIFKVLKFKIEKFKILTDRHLKNKNTTKLIL